MTVQELLPVDVVFVPVAHGVHVEEDVALSATEYVVTGHATHARVAFVAFSQEPAPHGCGMVRHVTAQR